MTYRVTRRRFVLGTVGSAAGSIVGAPSIAGAKPEKLRFLATNGSWAASTIKQAIPDFEKRYGIQVEVLLLPSDALQTRLRAELIGNKGGIDAAMWNPQWAGWLAPHLADHAALLKQFGSAPDDTDVRDFYGPALTLAQLGGKRIGIPYRVNAYVLFYLPEVLKQAGFDKPPATFEELRVVAKAVTQAGKGQRFGVGYGGKVSPTQTVFAYEPYLYSFGGDFYDRRSFDIQINSPVGVETLDYYAGLLTKDKVAPPEVTTWEIDEWIAACQTGRIAMSQMPGPWADKISTPQGRWETNGKWAFAPLVGRTPHGGVSPITGWNISATDSSKSREWAFRLVQHITNKQWFVKTLDSGNLPPVSTLETDKELAAKYPWVATTAAQLRTCKADPQEDIFPVLSARLAAGISDALTGQKTAKEALDNVAADWMRQMKRAKMKS